MAKGSSYGQPIFCWQGIIYLVKGKGSCRAGLSHNPGLDLTFWRQRGYQQLEVLTPPLPLGTAVFLHNQVAGCLAKGEQGFKYSQVLAALDRGWSRLGLPPGPRAGKLTIAPLPPPPPAELALVREVLAGRILWREELAWALAEKKLGVNTPLEDLGHWLYLAGEIELFPGVGYDPDGRPRCRRCGQATRLVKVSCTACGQVDCLLCEGCLAMGQSRRCRPLYARPRPAGLNPPARPPEIWRPRLQFDLTRAQADAYREAEGFVSQDQARECLLWAACGAGKTEVAYGAIAAALARGRHILYACPRKEVIRELHLRLQKVWPELSLEALYGGSPGKFGTADLTLATTHQALRFYRSFDLVILDEVDAFPLAGDLMLYHAVARARREQGQTLWLTATPPPELIARVRRGRLAVIYLPARHHGHPLPRPEFIREPFLKPPGDGPLPRSLVRGVTTTLAGGLQLLIFVPAVYMVDQVVGWLAAAWPGRAPAGDWIRGCYAAHPRREEVIAAFRRREFPVLVTTTVMERGVTIPRLNVLVLYADEERIFTASTLVQIAGRAGRSAEYPTGRVWFIARRLSPAMAEAVRQIREFNNLARRRGYLK
ncbi:helicase-related protein [Moorella naiadis]|uniref:helicase-related protein n=1 Tax=Moorella naiadis (nom. illeg.) TaxID=3093670 RepID=UPI003D9CB1A0